MTSFIRKVINAMTITDKVFYTAASFMIAGLAFGPPGFDMLHVPTAANLMIGGMVTMIGAAIVYVVQDILEVIRIVRDKDQDKK